MLREGYQRLSAFAERRGLFVMHSFFGRPAPYKQSLFLAAFVVIFALLTGCSALTGEDWIEGREAEPGIVVDYNLQNYVPVPTTGETPVLFPRPGIDMEASSVKWFVKGADDTFTPKTFSGGETFVEKTVYRAEITLTTTRDYTFDTKIAFFYHPAEVVAGAPDSNEKSVFSRTLSVTYHPVAGAKLLNTIDLSAIVPIPDEAQSSFVMTGDYSGLLFWNPAGSSFQTGTAYSVTAMLYPGPEKAFADAMTVSHNRGGEVTPVEFEESGALAASYGIDVESNSRAVGGVVFNGMAFVIITFDKLPAAGFTPGTPGTPPDDDDGTKPNPTPPGPGGNVGMEIIF
jgi:hypothetical protein